MGPSRAWWLAWCVVAAGCPAGTPPPLRPPEVAAQVLVAPGPGPVLLSGLAVDGPRMACVASGSGGHAAHLFSGDAEAGISDTLLTISADDAVLAGSGLWVAGLAEPGSVASRLRQVDVPAMTLRDTESAGVGALYRTRLAVQGAAVALTGVPISGDAVLSLRLPGFSGEVPVPGARECSAVAWEPGGRAAWVACRGRDAAPFLARWDAATPAVVQRAVPGLAGALRDLQDVTDLDATERVGLTACSRGTPRRCALARVEDGGRVDVQEVPEAGGGLDRVRHGAGGRWLALGRDGTQVVWDGAARHVHRPLPEIPASPPPPRPGVSADGRWALWGSHGVEGSRGARLWRVRTGL